MLYAPFRNLAVPGSVRYFGTIAPTVSGTLNDWTPTDFDNCYAILLDPSAATTITGMASALDGTEKLLVHAGADDFPVLVTHQDLGSTSGLRFEHGWVEDFTLHRGDCALYRREIASPRWRLINRQFAGYDPGYVGRTEASWWKVPGSCSRQRQGMFEAESLDGSVFLSIDDATGPLMSASTTTSPGSACGMRTGPRLYQRRWNVRAGVERFSVPTTLANTRARWGSFATFDIYDTPDPADLEGVYFQFDYDEDTTQVYAVTSDGATATTTALPTAPPGTQAYWTWDMNADRARFFHNGSLVHEETATLPAASTPLGQGISVELLTGGASVKRFTWARSWYSFGRVNA